MVESDTPGRLQAAETALRLAMLAVLGPRSINEKKFSQWSTKLEVLGLEFDTEQKTVSMPVAKIKKTLDRVRQAASNPTISKHDLECLLGSLRHVSTCLRTARPFFQRVHAACKRAPSRGRVPVSASLRIDFDWLQRILNGGQWRSLPTIMFYGDPPPDVHIYMDASDEGLAVLDPARQRYIRVQFDSQERDDITHCAGRDGFTINVRELFCIALAAKAWGSDWVPQFPSAMTFVRTTLARLRGYNRLTATTSWLKSSFGQSDSRRPLSGSGFLPAISRILPTSWRTQPHAHGSRHFEKSGLTLPAAGHRRKLQMRQGRCTRPSRESPDQCTGRVKSAKIRFDLATMAQVVRQFSCLTLAQWTSAARLHSTHLVCVMVLARA